MYRIRFHGRGGQGMKTASRVLGTAFSLVGFEVQDAPRYGAERRGAPIFAYVRAARTPINERGIIAHPDLVVVADETLVPVPAAGVLQGVDAHTIVLINSHTSADEWRHRLNLPGPALTVPPAEEVQDRVELPHIGAVCAGAAARLSAVIERSHMEEALRAELAALGGKELKRNLDNGLAAFDEMGEKTDLRITEGREASAAQYEKPEWVDLPFEDARVSAPVIYAALTSAEEKTGLWRTMRPVIDYARCNRCWWVCSSHCPDGAINVAESTPRIDYDHCKGCMVCVAVCPPHAIEAVPEGEAQFQEKAGGEP